MVTNALVELVNVRGKRIWECACGAGHMSEPLEAAGARVFSSDIVDHGYPALDLLYDFTSFPDPIVPSWDGIITNPPYGPRGKLAEAFIESGLRRIGKGFSALLLPADFDSAKTRAHLFGGCGQFAGKLVLTRRVKWFKHPTNPRMQPKENSAWYLWGNVEFRRLKNLTPVIHYAQEMAV